MVRLVNAIHLIVTRRRSGRNQEPSCLGTEREQTMKNTGTRSAIVTGASGGIGRIVAKRLASDGFAVAVHYAGNPAKAETVVTEIKGAGGKAIAVQADVAKPADVETLFKQTLDAFGTIDVVVHTA